MKAFCPFCEKEYNNLEVQTRYEITTLNGVTAEWQKKYTVCPDCGEELYNGKLHDANLRVVYDACKVSDIDKPVEDLCDYVLKLRMENAELRARLEEATELPVNVGDTIYIVFLDEIKEWQVEKIELCKDGYFVYCGHADTDDYTFVTSKEYGMRWFTDPVKAVLRLKEIQGGER